MTPLSSPVCFDSLWRGRQQARGQYRHRAPHLPETRHSLHGGDNLFLQAELGLDRLLTVLALEGGLFTLGDRGKTSLWSVRHPIVGRPCARGAHLFTLGLFLDVLLLALLGGGSGSGGALRLGCLRVVLLGLFKGLLEGLSVYGGGKDIARSVPLCLPRDRRHRRRRRRRGGLTIRVGKPDRKRLGSRLRLGVIGRDVPDPGSVGTEVGSELHVRGDCGWWVERAP